MRSKRLESYVINRTWLIVLDYNANSADSLSLVDNEAPLTGDYLFIYNELYVAQGSATIVCIYCVLTAQYINVIQERIMQYF